MRRRLTIEIEQADFERLAEVARRDRRDPRQQAAIVLERGLRTGVSEHEDSRAQSAATVAA